MPSIHDLPVELLYHVTQFLDDEADISAWCRAGSRLIREVAMPILYSHVKDEPGVFCWACDEGRIETVDRLLAVGANPDIEWVDDERRSRMLQRLHWKNMHDRSIYKDAERDAASDADFEEALELDSLASDDEDSNYHHDDDEGADSDVDSFFGSDVSSDAQVDWLDVYYSWTPLHIAA